MNKKPHNSGAELAERSDEELEHELSQSFPGGARWQGLTYEMSRRAGIKQERLTRRTYIAAIAAVAISILGIIVSAVA